MLKMPLFLLRKCLLHSNSEIQIWKYTVFDSNITKYVLPRQKLLKKAALLAVCCMKMAPVKCNENYMFYILFVIPSVYYQYTVLKYLVLQHHRFLLDVGTNN